MIVDKLNSRFKGLATISEEILVSFKSEHIHSFRVEIKKCKALYRLIGSGCKDPKKMKFPNHLQKIYKVLGVIRSFRMQEEKISASTFSREAGLPDRYISYLKAKQTSQIKIVLEMFGKSKRVKLNQQTFEYVKNRKLTPIFIEKYIQSITKKLIGLGKIQNKSDENLHDIRKILKDIQYTWGFIKHNPTGVASFFSDKSEIAGLTERLGEFHDLSVAIELLATKKMRALVIGDEQETLLAIGNKWKEEKERKKQELQTIMISKFKM